MRLDLHETVMDAVMDGGVALWEMMTDGPGEVRENVVSKSQRPQTPGRMHWPCGSGGGV